MDASSSSAAGSVEFIGAASCAVPFVDEEGRHTCKKCKKNYSTASALAYLNHDDMSFHVSMEGDMAKAVSKVRGEQCLQSGTSREAVLVCYRCAEEAHSTQYLNEGGKLNGKWRNAADKSKGRLVGHKLRRIAETIDKQADREGKDTAPLLDIVKAVRDERVALATDWVTQIAPGVNLLYGCPADNGCGAYPLRSNSWLRLSGLSTKQDGFWACANCLKRWTWRTAGHVRLFVIQSSIEDETMLAYVGAHTSESLNRRYEQELLILKGAQLVTHLQGCEITVDILLLAIEALNAQSERELMRRLRNVQHLTAQNPKEKFKTGIFCEDRRLSIEHPGFVYRAHVVTAWDMIPTLTSDELEHLLDVCSAFFDLAGFQPQGPAQAKTLAKMRDRVASGSVQDVVNDILSRM